MSVPISLLKAPSALSSSGTQALLRRAPEHHPEQQGEHEDAEHVALCPSLDRVHEQLADLRFDERSAGRRFNRRRLAVTDPGGAVGARSRLQRIDERVRAPPPGSWCSQNKWRRRSQRRSLGVEPSLAMAPATEQNTIGRMSALSPATKARPAGQSTTALGNAKPVVQAPNPPNNGCKSHGVPSRSCGRIDSVGCNRSRVSFTAGNQSPLKALRDASKTHQVPAHRYRLGPTR